MRHTCTVCFSLIILIETSTGYTYHNSRRDLFIPKVSNRITKLNYENKKPPIDTDIVNYFKNIRENFPFFKKENCPIYFDNAATTQKPSCVIRKLNDFYTKENANIHRGIYKMSLDATKNYENVRSVVKNYINCENEEEIIFTSGTTHGLNLICNMMMDKVIKKKEDEIHLTYLEHHSNIIPWQEGIHKKKKGKIKYIPLRRSGYINIKKLKKSINKNSKIISISHASNVLGNIQKLDIIIKTVREINQDIIIIIDAAQSFPHIKYNIKKMEENNSSPDILIASGHKFCAPLGSGFIYIKRTLTRRYKFRPLFYGSNIITNVDKYKSEFVSSPHLFESGTQNIAGIISMGVAIQFLQNLNPKFVYLYEMYLYDLFIYYLHENLQQNLVQLPHTNNPLDKQLSENEERTNHEEPSEFKIYVHNSRKVGQKKVPIVPLWSNKFTSFDLVTFLDFKNVCIRSGHHCASLLLKEFLHISNCARISIFFYNTPEEIHYLATQIASVSRMLYRIKEGKHTQPREIF
ncbi:cysteine desulfurase [Plasmodium gonderi]|uniref:Cysteine desulfurase n=1 Tax=Plasmodium gonderi TaxID=77519 RepID=A0A1Y1J9Y6_PLAGO|nr:cysteine desulfurase [Plasmodium gonderi]GAW79306.1 cysteine desulfurase [Plasmodium gonderi]